MTLEVHYYSPASTIAPFFDIDVSSALRLGSITGLAGEAELGAVGEGNIVLDDPLSTIGNAGDGIVGLKRMYFVETSCPVGMRRLYTSYIGDRRYHRGQGDSLITGPARKIDCTLTDLNSFLSFRVFAPVATDPDSSFDRPAETDLERIAAMLTVDFMVTALYDEGYIPTVGGVAMDANDYTGSTPADVLNDCAQQSGRNFFVFQPDESTFHLVLWYDIWTTDGSATTVYDSALRLTNVLSEHDGVTTFAIEPDAVEVLDPSRVVAGVFMPYTGGTIYRRRVSTSDTFAYRDTVAPSITVKSATKAAVRATRYLIDNSTEDSRISCTVQLPNSKVTGIHEGMRIQVHFTHLPLVNNAMTWCRILQRTIRQDQETPESYWLDLELSPIIVPPETFNQVVLIGQNVSFAAHNSIFTAGVPKQMYFAGAGTAVVGGISDPIAQDTDGYAVQIADGTNARGGYVVAECIVPAGLGGTYTIAYETLNLALPWYVAGVGPAAAPYTPGGVGTGVGPGVINGTIALDVLVNGSIVAGLHSAASTSGFEYFAPSTFQGQTSMPLSDGDSVTMSVTISTNCDAYGNTMGVTVFGSPLATLVLTRIGV